MSDHHLYGPAAPGDHPCFNARYVAYARALGLDPHAAIEHDRARFPGGLMAGYTIWLSEQWAAFDREHGRKGHARGPEEQAAFDAWLAGRA